MSDKPVDAEVLRKLRHDIKNQLSNITLLVGELRHELKDATPDCIMYLDMMEQSAFTIDELLKQPC
jgi:hypothetical protein